MSILFAISILSFCALLWASLSIARHIRVGNHARSSAPDLLLPDRPFRRSAMVGLDDPPLARRIHQKPTRTSSAPTST